MKRIFTKALVLVLALAMIAASALAVFADEASAGEAAAQIEEQNTVTEEPAEESGDVDAAAEQTSEQEPEEIVQEPAAQTETETAAETASDEQGSQVIRKTAQAGSGTAVYYTVTFVNGTGKTLKTEKVESGQAATAPADPVRSGYDFTGWDKDFSSVTANMTVTAQWKTHVHSWSGWKVKTKATYFRYGTMVRTCSCGATQTKAIAKLKGRNKWIKDNGKRYYLNKKGKPVTGWQKIKHFKSKTVKWCYFTKKGVYVKCVKKSTRNKWVKADGNKFYFGKKKKPLGKGFHFIGGKLYHMDKYGAVMYGKFKAVDGYKYTAAKNGTISTLAYYKHKYKVLVIIDISSQTLKCYKKGKLKLKTSVVTGHKGVHDTPTGHFSVKSKQRNINLVGSTWCSHVSYWMAFIGSSHGMHDASWRSSSQFSNHSTYKYNGSHGCVNMRYSAAKKLYGLVSVGTPVFVQK